jgi:hypothetical protein
MLACLSACLGAELTPQLSIVRHCNEGFSEIVHASRFDHPGSHSVLQHIADLPEPAGNDGLAGSHVLEELGGRAEEFNIIREWNVGRHEHIAGVDIRRDSGGRDLPNHTDPIFEAGVAEYLEGRSELLSITDQ